MKLDRKQDRNVPYQVCIFSDWSVNQDGQPGKSVNKGGILYSDARYVGLWASCYQHMIVHSYFSFALQEIQFFALSNIVVWGP